MKRLILFLTLAVFVSSCYRAPKYIEPQICAPAHPKEVQRVNRSFMQLPTDFSVSPFPPLSAKECSSDWGKEYIIALAFADDFDLYRAITGFKRARCLLPESQIERRLEIDYAIALAYYLGKKYVEAAFAVESTQLACVESNFPAFNDLLLILYDSYCELGREEQAAHILAIIEEHDADRADKLSLLQAVKSAQFEGIPYEHIMEAYHYGAKSVRKAELLNAVLPGAGYWYVEMPQTAVTALVINALFIGSTVALLKNGYYAPGLIMLSLESGWYLGGIYGAGLAAKAYNEQLYCSYASKITQREQLFPIMMLNYTF